MWIVVDLMYVLIILNVENDHVLTALDLGITNNSSVTFITFDTSKRLSWERFVDKDISFLY